MGLSGAGDTIRASTVTTYQHKHNAGAARVITGFLPTVATPSVEVPTDSLLYLRHWAQAQLCT